MTKTKNEVKESFNTRENKNKTAKKKAQRSEIIAPLHKKRKKQSKV